MEMNRLSKPAWGSDVFAVPFSPRQLLSCGAAVLGGWLLVCFDDASLLLLAGLLTLWVLVSCRGRGGSREHWLWLACLWGSVLTLTKVMPGWVLPEGVRMWSGEQWFFLALLFPYWCVCFSDLMTEKGSGCLWLDLYHCLVIFPFRWVGLLFLRLGRAVVALTSLLRDSVRRKLLLCLATMAIAGLFLLIALGLLRQADAAFGQLVDSFFGRVYSMRFSTLWLERLILGLPFGALMYSLICGSTGAVSRKDLAEHRDRSLAAMARLRLLPTGCWAAMLGVFTALYLLFFGVQGTVLLQVLRSRLAPGDQTMAAYAVQGFWQLVALMVLNLALLLTARLTAARPLGGTTTGRVMLSALMGATLLFAVSAGIKLGLYIHCFGLTTLRLQGAWAILVLTAGCLCTLVWVWTGRSMTRRWCRVTGVLLLASLLL